MELALNPHYSGGS